ncbi:nitroreductase family protein [[Clostridium] hylemonae]|uniref:nitroreductase family protein n=1 Tax=[Clostridium] hylemonae TaxID=89153 RepID=UPI001FCB257A|nr:nitroreductase family protein [[Clostridium] hylemonae]BDF04705.1 nitroreductase [[Clostridium] hylemonae]
MNKHHVEIDACRCIGCGACVRTCAAHNIELKNKKAETISSDCLMCGQCTAVCPAEAVSISGYETKDIIKTNNERLDPKQVLDVIRFRRSVRQFQDKKIPGEVIDEILEAGRLTHTAKNKQDVSFAVLDREKDHIEQMAVSMFRKWKPLADLFSPMARQNKIDRHFFFFKAPIVIVIMAENKTNGILAAQNMEFAAEANGLGVLFSGFFTMAANSSLKIRKALKMPKKKRAAMTLVLGYPRVKFLRSVQREKLKVTYL